MKTTSKLLFNDEPITINRLAAKVIGLNEAIVIQQIHYWLEINRKAKINYFDDRTWSYNSINKWQRESFDFWSVDTVKRTFTKLVKSKILITGNYNEHKYDKTIWYSIDYEKLDNLLNEYEEKHDKNDKNVENSTLVQNAPMSDCNISAKCPNGLGQNAPMDKGRLHQPIPKTTKDFTKTSFCTTHTEQIVPVVDTNKELIEANTKLTLSNDMKRQIKNWDSERLKNAIDIFKKEDGLYFSFLKKIYKDDNNFKPVSNNSVITFKSKKTRFHNVNETFRNYDPDELEKHLLEMQKEKGL